MEATNELCPKHNLPIQQDEQYVNFHCGERGMIHSLSLKLRVTWCPHGECKDTTVVTVIPTKIGKLP